MIDMYCLSMTEDTRTTRTDLDTARDAVVGLLRASDHVRRHLAETMETFGLTGQQYNVLRILRGAHPEPLATLDLASRMIEKTPGITRLLDRLERKGLIERHRPTTDRRRVLCSITPQGMHLLSTMDEAVRRANGTALRGLSSRDLRMLSSLLERIPSASEGG